MSISSPIGLLGLILPFAALPAFAADTATSSPVPFQGFPFAIPWTGFQPGTAPAALGISGPPAGSEGFISRRDNQFIHSDSGNPVRFWGVNLCFAGAFPPRDQADRLALRLAALGVNCVRFHHIDQRRFPGGIWKRDAAGVSPDVREDDIDHSQFDPEALDRLDYFISRLKALGIYSNLNLKVSRTFSSFDGFEQPQEGAVLPGKGKGIDQFFQPAIDAQKNFARMFLTHVNAYTGNSYVEEPAVAMVEINNENGILWAFNYNILDKLPSAYLNALRLRWQAWLAPRYQTTDALRAAWSRGEIAPAGGSNLLASVPARLVTYKGAKAVEKKGDPVRLSVQDPGSQSWQVRYLWDSVDLDANVSYEAKLHLRSNKNEKVRIRLRRDGTNDDLASDKLLEVTPEGVVCTVSFAVSDNEDVFNDPAQQADEEARRLRKSVPAQLCLELARPGLELDISQVSLSAHGGIVGLPEGQALEEGRKVAWVRRGDLPGRSEGCVSDVMLFLRELELSYWKEMRDFLVQDLKVRVPVTGTAVGYSTSQIMADAGFDFIDSHRYWGHPRFPNYDRSKDWTVDQKAMSSFPAESTIERLSARRVFGLPFTVTEYNHPVSNDYAAEGFPLISIWGDAQDWNGIFGFAYSHSDEWESDALSGFMDTKASPAHCVTGLAAAAIFRHASIAPFSTALGAHVPLARQILRQNNYAFPRMIEADAVFGGVPADAWLTRRIGILPSAHSTPPPPSSQADSLLQWRTAPSGGSVEYAGRGVAGLIGFVAGRTLDLGWLRLTPGQTSLGGFSVIMLNAVDGQALGRPGRYLLTSVVRSSNQNMGWNPARTGFGKNWGHGPILAETAPLSILFKDAPPEIFALNPDGSRRHPVSAQGSSFSLDPSNQTLWYEIVLK